MGNHRFLHNSSSWIGDLEHEFVFRELPQLPFQALNQEKLDLMSAMKTTICTPENIAKLAYFIWIEEGRPHGKDHEHWLEAEALLKHADRKLVVGCQQADVLQQPQINTAKRPLRYGLIATAS